MTQPARTPTAVRRLLRVTGVVQGVGFRPFVHRLACDLRLSGHVGNDGAGVFIEVEGPAEALDGFEARLEGEAPPLARIFSVVTTELVAVGEGGFSVVASAYDGAVRTFVSPDVAVCEDCLEELFDPADLRYRYPFVNCTNCGPRFTITVRLPYDRRNTTMASFAMCSQCAAEYEEPSDRRFHAQPVACPSCGPRLWFEPAHHNPTPDHHDAQDLAFGDDAIAATQTALGKGEIIAVKGIGGYHLACDATNDSAVESLRCRKGRPDKPFALMVRDLEVVRRIAVVGQEEERLLRSPQRPIVLLRRLSGALVSDRVAPRNPRLGVMLPYSPLHHLLFAPVPGQGTAPVAPPVVLVMTSANLSEEPICYRDDDAHDRMGGIADGWLVHDRPIHVPCDDSVVGVVGGVEVPIRRSRGYAPVPLELPCESPSVLAVGGDLKNTFCLTTGRHAWLSQHIGDMGTTETLEAFETSVRQVCDVYETEPRTLVADMHPGYQSRRWAERRAESGDLCLDVVQHHHAHLAAVMAEHGLGRSEKVVGICFDGTGYGADGTVWGGEVLLGGYAEAQRISHLRYVPLPGGDGAVRKPYRMALSHLRAAGLHWEPDLAPVRHATEAGDLEALERQLERGAGCVATSSIGRLFDAVSALVGVCEVTTYEAQAAIELEAAAERPVAPPGTTGLSRDTRRPYRFAVGESDFSAAPVLSAIVDDIRRSSPLEEISFDFHEAVAHLVAEVAATAALRAGVDTVVLSGGVFQNSLLFSLVLTGLAERGLRALTHTRVPPNDGGLALGQAAVSAVRACRT
jgi:hydrogenase maturation protein HypF